MEDGEAMTAGGLRRISVALALCVLTAGCTVTTGGHVVAAPTLGRAPEPLPAHALEDLLLDTSDIGTIMGARVDVIESGDSMYRNQPLDDGCLVWAEAQQYSYQGSGWTAVRVQQLRDRRDDADHIVYQAVVAFPDAMAASEFYESQVSEWGQCDDQRVDLHDAGDPNAHYWTLSEAADENGILTITREQEESTRGWSCQRALTAENNVVADVSACAYDVDDRGAQIAEQIANKIAEQ